MNKLKQKQKDNNLYLVTVACDGCCQVLHVWTFPTHNRTLGLNLNSETPTLKTIFFENYLKHGILKWRLVALRMPED